MTKKHFIALADKIRAHNATTRTPFTSDQLDTLAGFCMDSNPRFNYDRWLDYIAGKCGPSGGNVKVTTVEDEIVYHTDGEGFEVWSG